MNKRLKRSRSLTDSYHSPAIVRMLGRGMSEQDDRIVSHAIQRAYSTLLRAGVEGCAPAAEIDFGWSATDPQMRHFEDMEEFANDLRVYQHGLPEALRQRYRSEIDQVMAEFYACPVAHWQAWSAFIEQGSICTGTTRRGTPCTRVVGQIPSPQDFIAGLSDRCRQHKTTGFPTE